MANQILAGAVVQAGYIIAGVDADNPPYVGPPAHWAETQYGFYSAGGSAQNEYSSTTIYFSAPQNDVSGLSILTEVDTKITDNQVFKIEFRNSNKVVLSLQSPHRIETGLAVLENAEHLEDPTWSSHHGWNLSISTSGPLVGNGLSPTVGLNGSGVNFNETTCPPPSIGPGNVTSNAYNVGSHLSTDQIYFYDQAGEVIANMDLSDNRTGNGFDADGSPSDATSLTSLVFPPEPYNYFTASSVSDWYMFGSSTVSEPTDGTFRFTRVAGNGNVGQFAATGLTGGASYVISATGDTSQNDYVAEFTLQNANWGDIDGSGPLEQSEGGVLDWAAGATNDTQSVTFTMPAGETSVTVRVRLGYETNYSSNTLVWDFSNIKINDA